MYQNNKLFQSKTFKTKSNFSQKIISGSTNENNSQGASVDIVFNPKVSFSTNNNNNKIQATFDYKSGVGWAKEIHRKTLYTYVNFYLNSS